MHFDLSFRLCADLGMSVCELEYLEGAERASGALDTALSL